MLSEGALKWLEHFCISKETAEHFHLETEDHRFPELECDRRAIRIPYNVNGTWVGSRWVDNKENWTCDLKEHHLWNVDNRKPTTLYICDNELAVMALHGVGVPAVCPSDYGNPASMADVKYLHDVLVGFTEVCLLFSKTQESVAWERSLSHLFVTIKATTTHFHDECITLFDVIKKHGKKGIDDIIESRTQLPPHGIKSFTDDGQEIYDYYHGKKVRSYSTGIGKLDEFFRIQPGALHIITGSPSAGKGELIDQIMVNTIRLYGWTWLVHSPENSPSYFHWQKIAEKQTGKPMFGKDRMSEEQMMTALTQLNSHIKFIPPEDGALTLDEILDLARLAVARFHINAVVIDPYNEVEHDIRDGETESNYISLFLSKVRNFGRVNEVATFVVAHPTKLKKNEVTGDYPPCRLYDISGSAHWYNKADVGLSVWRSFQKQTNEVSVFVSKMRNKNMGKTGEIKLYWNWRNGILEEENMPDFKNQSDIPD